MIYLKALYHTCQYRSPFTTDLSPHLDNLSRLVGYSQSTGIVAGNARIGIAAYRLFKARNHPISPETNAYLRMQLIRGQCEIMFCGWLFLIPDIACTLVALIKEGASALNSIGFVLAARVSVI